MYSKGTDTHRRIDMKPSWMMYKDTPGHGYYSVDPEHWNRMQQEHPELLTKTAFFHGCNSFEEDCEVHRITLAFRDEVPEEWVKHADHWLINSHPEMYEAYTGRKVDPRESRELQRKSFAKMTRNFYVAYSASNGSSWVPTVPEGFVGVYFTMGQRDTRHWDKRRPVRALLIPKDEYRNRPVGFSFYIEDPSLYDEWKLSNI